MKKLLIFSTATVAVSFASMTAHATVLDFVAEAAGAERGVVNGSTITNFQGTGVDVTFTAGGGDWYPYFDDLSGGKPAGLGVCKVLNVGPGGPGDDGASDDCNPPDDDNVSAGESITLAFGGVDFSIRGVTFYDAVHNVLGVPGNDGAVEISLNGGLAMMMLFSEAIAAAAAGEFADAASITLTYVDTQFYIGALSDVPAPGALPLLLSGLAGLGFALRRKKKAA